MGFSLGDKITFIAGPILDHNQHPVPDDTQVQFIVEYPAEKIPPQYLSVFTKAGMAQADYTLDRQGQMQVSASSEPAKNSVILQLVVGEKPAFITAIAPTRSEVPSESPTTFSNPTPQPTPNGGSADRAGWDTFFVLLVVLGAFAGSVFAATTAPGWSAFRWRAILGVLVGGLAGYDLFALGLPGTSWGGRWVSVVAGVVGGIAGAGVAWWSVHRSRE
jgi:hypothetical protein